MSIINVSVCFFFSFFACLFVMFRCFFLGRVLRQKWMRDTESNQMNKKFQRKWTVFGTSYGRNDNVIVISIHKFEFYFLCLSLSFSSSTSCLLIVALLMNVYHLDFEPLLYKIILQYQMVVIMIISRIKIFLKLKRKRKEYCSTIELKWKPTKYTRHNIEQHLQI